MTNGVITGNSALRGGGIHLDASYPGGTLNMRGGTITSNTAGAYGGGVFVGSGKFSKTGGSITGFNSDQNNGNVVKDETGNTIARRGPQYTEMKMCVKKLRLDLV